MIREKVVAVAGNPNAGKTTVFNMLTRSHQHTGNWPGVTVEKKYGYFFHREQSFKVVDLPGTYSMMAHSLDERITRDFLLSGEADIVVIVADASLLERHLYLAVQCLEMGLQVVLCLNMMDMAEEQGLSVDHERMSGLLGVPVVPCVAITEKGIDALKDAVSEGGEERHTPFQVWYGHRIEEYIAEMEERLKSLDLSSPSRWAAIRFIEDDPDMISRVEEKDERTNLRYEWLKGAIQICQTLGYDDLPTYIAEKRYGFVHGVVRESVSSHSTLKRIDWTKKIDTVLTSPIVGMPLFFLFLWLAFQLIFTVGNPFAGFMDTGFSAISESVSSFLTEIHVHPLLVSFLTNGVIAGVGSVLVFLPNILLLFFIFSIMENSGYMARAAFIMDRFMHTMGLHGKSFIPMVLGFGCNVPAIMGTRILESDKDRILTILIIPLMSCSARLPIYILFTGVFFARHQGLVVLSLYVIGGVLATIMARVFQFLFFRYETAPLVMELPPYHMPSLKGALYHMWMRATMFLKKAGTVIFGGVVLIWILANLPPGTEYAGPGSLIGRLGSLLAPVFAPAGFGFYEAAVALVSGVVAKEIVVGTLGTLYGDVSLSEALATHFTALSAYAFMLMSLIYLPCLSTIAVIRKEAGLRWAVVSIVYTSLLGWVLAVAVYQIGSIF